MRVSGSRSLIKMNRAECILKELLEQKNGWLYVDEIQEKCCVNAKLKALKCQIAVVVDFSTVIKQDEQFV